MSAESLMIAVEFVLADQLIDGGSRKTWWNNPWRVAARAALLAKAGCNRRNSN